MVARRTRGRGTRGRGRGTSVRGRCTSVRGRGTREGPRPKMRLGYPYLYPYP